MKTSLFIISMFFSISLAYCQVPGIKNYTTRDGLPSDEVFKCILASDGYMWFATNDGVSQYDGSHFKNFELSDGLTENTILDMQEDKVGRIWFVGLSGQLSYFENDSIFQFKGNHLISKNKTSTDIPNNGLFIPISKTEIKISFYSGKTLHIKGDNINTYETKKGDSVQISLPNDEYLFYINKTNKRVTQYTVIFDSVKYTTDAKRNDRWGHNMGRNLYLEYPDRVVYFYQKNAITIFRNGEIKKDILPYIPIQVAKSRVAGVWITTYKNGLIYFPDLDFSKKPTLNLLKDQFTTSIIYDPSNRGWVTTSYGGVFNFQSLYITNYFKNGLYAENFTSKIVKLDSDKYIYFARNNRVFINHTFFVASEELVLEELKNQLVYQAKLVGDDIYAATAFGIIKIPIAYFLDPKHPKDGIKTYYLASIKDILFQDSILWIATGTGLFYVENFLDKNSFEPIRLANVKDRINVLSPYNNNKEDSYSYMLFQGVDKLFQLKYKVSNGQITTYTQREYKSDKLMSNNDIVQGSKNGFIYLGTRGGGLQIITKDSILTYDTDSNVLSNTISVLKMPGDSIILAGTNKGLNVIKLSKEKYPKIIKSKFITSKDGLKGNEIHDIKYQKGHALVATNIGVSLINISNVINVEDNFPIYITSFKVNNVSKNMDSTNVFKLKPQDNNIRILFNAIDFHDKKAMKYMYRLKGSYNEEWKTINESEVAYPQLNPGNYTFEVKSKNSYGFSSKNIASISFLLPEIFYQTLWFKLLASSLIIALFVGYFYLLFFKRNEVLRDAIILEDFQQKSLLRIMNPHFIFNSLNSVNSYIINNRKEDAVKFVSQFAKLIRRTFDSAYENNITVDDEISFLKSYLKLEHRRLNNKFQYIIKSTERIDNFYIPTFMIQVFVENSIWHGISKKEENGSLITVIFYDDKEHILCEITDNGIGRKKADETLKDKPNKRKTHGIDVVNQRISLINKNLTKTQIQLEIIDGIKKDKSSPSGTKVILRFPKRLHKNI